MKLEGYSLLRRLAIGGMAELYRARREADGVEVALKIVLPQHARDPGFVEMLMDEARLARRLEHAGLVRVLDHGAAGETAFLAMELVEGPSLAALLAAARSAGRLLPPALGLGIARELLEALRYLHELRDPEGALLEVVHRDVTPGNVLVEAATGRVKLGDFGIAQHRLRSTKTRTGVIKGTVQYMAPEQVTGSGIDARTDLYGVGLILFELLTLRPFVEAEREIDLLRLVESPPWRAPSSLRPELPAVLDELVGRALRRFPEERYPDAGAFLAALDRAAASLPSAAGGAELAALCSELSIERDPGTELVGASESPAAAARATRITAPAPRRSLLPLGLAGALAVLVALAVWLGLRAPSRLEAPRPDARAAVRTGRIDAAGPDASPRDAALARASAAPDGPRRRKLVVRPAPRRGDAGAPAAARGASERAALAARLKAAVAAAAARGVLVEDLSGAVAARLRSAEQSLARDGDPGPLAAEVRALEGELGAARVTRALVEAKLRRVDALLQRRGGSAPRALRDAASLALQEFMDGRYAEANRELNAILRAL